MTDTDVPTGTATPATTSGAQAPPRGHAPPWLTGAISRIEGSDGLDGPVAAVDAVSERLLGSPEVESALRGDWAGHALHPLLTDFPLGAWLSASLLDLFGGRRSRPAATGLVAFGVAMSLPTAAAGLAEWRSADRTARRVALVHAGINGVVAAAYTGSLVARLGGRHRRGVALALLGGSAAWVSGYLGGHLSLVRKIGTSDPAFGGPATDRDPVDGA